MDIRAYQSGTVSRAAPSPAVAAVRLPETKAESPEVQPSNRTFEDPRGRIREQVLAERGLDAGDFLKMAPQTRIETEIQIAGEIARRLGARRILDIRV